MVHLGLPTRRAPLRPHFHAQAEVKGQPWSMARAVRPDLLPRRDVDARFSVALAYHQAPDDFEAARTELAYGARLRRVRADAW